MERLPSLTRAGRSVGRALPLALLLAPLVAAGCASATRMAGSMKVAVNEVVPFEKPTPASQVICFWQRRLVSLPDPIRDGSQTPGLPGQMFLISPDSRPADVDGDLAVMVYDETPRTGTAAMKPEVWHYTKDTLKRLGTNDERFGRSYVLFLPWPAHWKDVTAVKILARYQSGGSDIHAEPVRVALDFSDGAVWSGTGTQPAPGSARPDAHSVPSPTKMLEQARAAASAAPATPPAGVVTQAAAWAAPLQSLPPPTIPTGGVAQGVSSPGIMQPANFR